MTDIREQLPPATAPAAPQARALAATGPGRVVGLDGIRGLAALYVVVYHIFLRAWPGYPGANHAPFWAALLSHGRGAVAMFIALSGFSLGLGPARSGWQFKSIGTYAHRRAWRILPPYWAALGFSLVMTWYVQAQPHLPVPNGKSVVVYGLLVQDVFAVGSPNRAFWSIAIEAQLYVLLPLLLLLVRRVSAWAMVGLVAAIVVTIGVLGPHVAMMNTALVKFTPDLAVLFADRLAGRRDRHRRRAHSITALGRLRAGRRGAGNRVNGGQGLSVVVLQSVLARSGLGSGDRLLPRRGRHLAPAVRRPLP